MKIYLPILAFLCFSLTAFAQVKKTVHQTFELEEATKINLNLVGEYEIVPWAGNTIMTETKIELSDASPAILKFFVEEKGRYEIEGAISSDAASLKSKVKGRKAIQYKGVDCYEVVKIRVFVPEEFEKISETQLVKSE